MAITTFAALADMCLATDTDILDALTSLHKPPIVEQWRVQLPKKHWWSSARYHILYTVLWPLGDTMLGPEWQVVNFYREDSGTSINTVVNKEMVLAYLYGCSVTRANEEP